MNIAIIGGGIGGLATAIGLHNINIKAHVFEQASTFQPLGAGIGIGSNVMVALNKLGVKEDIMKSGMSLKEQRFLNGDFELMNTIDFSLLKDRFGEETITIQRADLHKALLQSMDDNYFHLNKKVVYFKQTTEKVIIKFSDGSVKSFDYVIAADGIHSIFRQTLIPSSQPRYAGYTCWRGITKNTGDVQAHISSEVWSKQGRFGWAPLYNGDVYWFACINTQERNPYYAQLNKDDVANKFAHLSPVVERLIRETYEDYFLHHDIYDIKPLRTFIYDRVCLLGDAAHATTPNMGQGAGQSIEDAFELMQAFNSTSVVANAFKQYEHKRIWKTKKVINLSRQIGWVAQWDNSALIAFRDTVFPYVPKSLLFWRLTFLFK